MPALFSAVNLFGWIAQEALFLFPQANPVWAGTGWGL